MMYTVQVILGLYFNPKDLPSGPVDESSDGTTHDHVQYGHLPDLNETSNKPFENANFLSILTFWYVAVLRVTTVAYSRRHTSTASCYPLTC